VTKVRITLFVTCLNDTLFPEAGRAVVEVLEGLGHEIDFPLEQTCCGQLHGNTGAQADATVLMRRFVRVFGDAEVIVTPSGSCAGMVREQYLQLAAQTDDIPLQAAVAAIAARTFELSELIVDVLGITDVGAVFPHRVTYHPTCHSARVLNVGDRPLRLLAAVRGIELVDLPDAPECCGFGGTFAVKNHETSTAILTDKIQNVLSTGAEVVVAGDNSCLMHIGGGLTRQRAGVRTLHLAEVLAAR
jgi:L-lactate dehydrogenase complex protein LldE